MIENFRSSVFERDGHTPRPLRDATEITNRTAMFFRRSFRSLDLTKLVWVLHQKHNGEIHSMNRLDGFDRRVATFLQAAVQKAGNCVLVLATMKQTTTFQKGCYSDPLDETHQLEDIVGEYPNVHRLECEQIDGTETIHALEESFDDDDYKTEKNSESDRAINHMYVLDFSNSCGIVCLIAFTQTLRGSVSYCVEGVS